MNEYEEKAKKIIKEAEICRPKGICCYGKTGATGPTGPAGPAGQNSTLGGIQVQLVSPEGLLLNQNEPVLFDTIIANTSPDITYQNGHLPLPKIKLTMYHGGLE